MWNKPEQDAAPDQPTPQPAAGEVPKAERQAILGPSITIKGTLSGQEDLLIEGRVEGEISFKQHAVTVGQRGRVDADLFCKRVYVEGQVNGNLHGDELVVIRKSGRVKGDAAAPRVSLEDGALFRGKIDTQSHKPEVPKVEKEPPGKPKSKPGALSSASAERRGTPMPAELSSKKTD